MRMKKHAHEVRRDAGKVARLAPKIGKTDEHFKEQQVRHKDATKGGLDVKHAHHMHHKHHAEMAKHHAKIAHHHEKMAHSLKKK